MVKLPRLPYGWKDQPQLFERYWDQAMSRIETNINDLLSLPAIQEAIIAANNAANSANTAANAAQEAADEAAAITALSSSGVSGAVISATDAGSSASISVSSHTRLYGDGSSVSVNGGSVTGLLYSTTYYLYYDQAIRVGGSVLYQVTTIKEEAAQVNDRHLVGVVKTPAAAAGPVTGNYVDLSGLGSILY